MQQQQQDELDVAATGKTWNMYKGMPC
jgi:hypothetical protein